METSLFSNNYGFVDGFSIDICLNTRIPELCIYYKTILIGVQLLKSYFNKYWSIILPWYYCRYKGVAVFVEF